MGEPITTIKVTQKHRELIGKAASRHDRPLGEFVHQCVLFVHKHRYNPYDLKDMSIADEFKKLRDSLVGFIRQQEKDHIVPMHNAVNDMTRQLVSTVDIMEGIYSKTADFEDDLTTGQANQASAAEIDNESIKLLRAELDKKNKIINQAIKDMDSLKKAAKRQRGKVLLELAENDFDRIVSLGSRT